MHYQHLKRRKFQTKGETRIDTIAELHPYTRIYNGLRGRWTIQETKIGLSIRLFMQRTIRKLGDIFARYN